MHLPEGALATLMFLSGLGLAIFILLRRSYRYFGRRSKPGPALPRVSQPDQKCEQPLADAPPDLARWQVEMHDTARELKAELDTKMRLLQVLIGQARQERERLEAAVEEASKVSVP